MKDYSGLISAVAVLALLVLAHQLAAFSLPGWSGGALVLAAYALGCLAAAKAPAERAEVT
jgi:hypothetical protein